MLDVKKIRDDFPVLKNNKSLIYFDNGATSLKPQVVIDKTCEYYAEYGVNIHRGVYDLSYKATEEYEETRKIVARFINAKTKEIVFTKGATDSLNMLALALSDCISPGDEILTTELEHHSSMMPYQQIASSKNAILKYVPLNEEGRITVENFKQTITDRCKIVAITYVSNVLGYITPLEEIIKIAHEHHAIVIVDAAQAVPHIKIDVKALDADFLAFSAHKMLGPTGFGILYGKYKLLNELNPVTFGGDMNDEVRKFSSSFKDAPYKFEAGTPNIAGAIAFKEAIKYLDELGMDAVSSYIKDLTTYIVNELIKIEGVELYNKTSDTGIISFNLVGIHPHDVASFYDDNHIALRAGHHCAQLITNWLEVSGTLRASLYIYNTYEEANCFIETTKKAVEFFRKWRI